MAYRVRLWYNQEEVPMPLHAQFPGTLEDDTSMV